MLSITLYEKQYIAFDIPPSDKPQTVKVIFKQHKSARKAQLVIDAPDRIKILRPRPNSCPTSNCPPDTTITPSPYSTPISQTLPPDPSPDSPSLPNPNIES